MKKCKLLFIAAFSVITFNTFAQTAFEEKKSYASVGYGYQLLSRKDFFDQNQSAQNYKSKGFGPLVLKYEYAISEKIGIGASMSYTTASVSWDDLGGSNGFDTTYRNTYKFTKYTITPRINFHYGDNEKLDLYTGFGVGMRRVNNVFSTTDPAGSKETFKQGVPISLEITTGARFLFTEQIGVFVEVGVSSAFL
ncbi:MAG: outer membrane beta-barrel protein, partial [Bacteroidetes bacterium]|nr:outer membrane beta-barrel protein [Bacteroidota bacterium]